MTSTMPTPTLQLLDPLTPSEEKVLGFMAQGLSDKEIALQLNLAPITIRGDHKQNIYDKLGLETGFRNRKWAVYCARELGLLPKPTEADADLPSPGDNPYKGLDAFQQTDADLFFGREDFTAHLLERLHNASSPRFLAMVGPSGSGKSSVVHAGLIPALRQNRVPGAARWAITTMFPRVNPLYELELALRSVAVTNQADILDVLQRDAYGLARAARLILPEDQPLLLIIDQFEELFTLVQDSSLAGFFMDLLHAAVTDPHSSVRVLITLRADLLDRPLMVPDFGGLVQNHTVMIVPLTPAELERAITLPAKQAHVTIDPGLVARLVAEANDQPGALPLLEFALTELYDQRVGRTITMNAYEEIGGLRRALAAHAERVYAELDAGQREATRQLFLRLITLGEGTEDLRRRVSAQELAALQEQTKTLHYVTHFLAANRLLTLDIDPTSRKPTAEVAHEALIREWGRLRDWLDESRNDVRMQRLLATAVVEWQHHDHDESYLMRGSKLAQFEGWRAGTDLALTTEESRFLDASNAEHERRVAAEQHRQQRELDMQRRAANRLRYIAVSLVMFLVVATGLALYALGQQQEAQTNQRNAQTSEAIAEANAATAERSEAEAQSLLWANAAQDAFQNQEYDLALALALASASIEDPPLVARDALAGAAHHATRTRTFSGHADRVNSVVYSPDGQTALSGSDDTTLILWDVSSGQPQRSFIGHTATVNSVAFSPDGTLALSGSADNTLILWDVAGGQALRTFTGHTDVVNGVAFSPDGALALSGSNDNTLILWDVSSGTALHTLSGHYKDVNSVAFSPDGTTALSGSADQTLILWDVASGQSIRRFIRQGLQGTVYSVAFSPDGTLALSGAGNTNLFLWDVGTGQPTHTLSGHTGWVYGVAFSPDGRTALSGSDDGTLILWDVANGQARRTFSGRTDWIYGVAYSPDGTTALTGSENGTLTLWDIDNEEAVRTFSGHTDWVNSVVHSPDGTLALSGSRDKTLVLWDMSSSQPIRTFSGHTGLVNSVAFSPDGTMALSGSGDTTLILWDVGSGQPLRTFTDHTDWVSSVAFSPDGALALSGARDASLILWDVDSGQLLHSLSGHQGDVLSVVFSPDGQTAVSGSRDDTLILWDVDSGQPLRTFSGHQADVLSVVFSTDGSLALSGSRDDTLILWDVASGQPRQTFTGHQDDVESVALSPDSTLAVSGSRDDTLVLWDVASGQPLRTFSGHQGNVQSVTFGPDGTTILSASADHTLKLWHVQTPDELVAWVYQNLEVRELTCQERAIHRFEPGCDNAGIYPTRTPHMSWTPMPAPVATN